MQASDNKQTTRMVTDQARNKAKNKKTLRSGKTSITGDKREDTSSRREKARSKLAMQNRFMQVYLEEQLNSVTSGPFDDYQLDKASNLSPGEINNIYSTIHQIREQGNPPQMANKKALGYAKDELGTGAQEEVEQLNVSSWGQGRPNSSHRSHLTCLKRKGDDRDVDDDDDENKSIFKKSKGC